MIYLLDTHYILWALFEPEKIGASVKAILENETDTKMVSAVSVWEISLKYSLGKLELHGTTPEEIRTSILEAGFELLEVESELLASFHKLPKKTEHRDPFDRLLIWQAISSDYSLISSDAKVALYVPDGLLLAG